MGGQHVGKLGVATGPALELRTRVRRRTPGLEIGRIRQTTGDRRAVEECVVTLVGIARTLRRCRDLPDLGLVDAILLGGTSIAAEQGQRQPNQSDVKQWITDVEHNDPVRMIRQ